MNPLDQILQRIQHLERSNSELVKQIAHLDQVLKNHRHLKHDQTKSLFPTTFAGWVASDGTANFLPDGWTSGKAATGKYTVTHNLKHTDYAVAVLPDIISSFDTRFTHGIYAHSTTAFSVNLINEDTGLDADRGFQFVLVTA